MFFYNKNPFFRSLGMAVAGLIGVVWGVTGGDGQVTLIGTLMTVIGIRVMILQVWKPLH